jgi:arylsulfatase A
MKKITIEILRICAAILLTGNSFAQQKPNIVFILADDLGWADLGCYGNPFNLTPNIDKLAKEGIRFTQAYSSCPVCSPSRASIMTGKHPARLKLTNFIGGDRVDTSLAILPAKWKPYLASEEITMAEMLKEQGYTTGMVGKWHLGIHDTLMPYKQGFDYNRVIAKSGGDYYNYNIATDNNKIVFQDSGKTYLTDKLGDYGVEFIEKNKDKPFFLYMAHFAPHVFIVPRGDKLRPYLTKYTSFDCKYNPYYAAVVESLDDAVGKLVETLKKNNLLENTIIIFTSDNGGLGLPEAGPIPTNNEPLRKWKGHAYEGGIRVPAIVSWKGKFKESVSDQYYINSDYFPTFAEIVGSNKKSLALDGKSIYQVFTNPEKPMDRGSIYWHYPHISNQGGRFSAAIRNGDFKLVENYETGSLELYNLKEDISEKNDLASAMPAKLKELKAQLDKWRIEVKANMPEANLKYIKK